MHPGIILDTNPPDDDSWWYRLFEENTDAEDGRGAKSLYQRAGYASGRTLYQKRLT